MSKGGASSTGGSDQFGGATSAGNEGGALNTGGLLNTGGTLSTGGMSSGGTLSSTTLPGDGGSDDLQGCAFVQTGGKLLVPPSQGFESDLGSWTTTSGNTTSLSRLAGNGANCEGNWYMHCDGTRRTAQWEAPAIEVVSFVTVGHTYQLSVAARAVPANSAAMSLKLTYSVNCPGISQPVYVDPYTVPVLTNWVRLTTQFAIVAPAGCTAPVNSVRLYVASVEAAGPFPSIDVDDFKLIDLSASGTSDAGG